VDPLEAQNGGPVRVLIADDDAAIRSLLVALIDDAPDLELVGEADDAEKAIAMVLAQRPDAVLLDWWMPAGGGPRAAREIASGFPSTRIVAFSAYSGAAACGEMLEAGAHAYLVKSEQSNDDILDAVRRTVRALSSAA
jgi:DNA-binding NarL/FixJ family response regulator